MQGVPRWTASLAALACVATLAVAPATASPGQPDRGLPRTTATADSAPTRFQVESRLKALGLPVGAVDGTFTAYTRRGLCAWRELTGRRPHRAFPGAAEMAAIVHTVVLQVPADLVTGVNVNRTCQTAVWVGSPGSLVRLKGVFPVSTGMPGYSTHVGIFRVQRRIDGWHESTLYDGAMLYRPLYFSGGQALHGSITDTLVLPYPASHGCVRMLHADVDRLWSGGFAVGQTVRVYGTW